VGGQERGLEDDPAEMAAWDALVTAGPTGDETAIVERVPLDVAKAALDPTGALNPGVLIDP